MGLYKNDFVCSTVDACISTNSDKRELSCIVGSIRLTLDRPSEAENQHSLVY